MVRANTAVGILIHQPDDCNRNLRIDGIYRKTPLNEIIVFDFCDTIWIAIPFRCIWMVLFWWNSISTRTFCIFLEIFIHGMKRTMLHGTVKSAYVQCVFFKYWLRSIPNIQRALHQLNAISFMQRITSFCACRSQSILAQFQVPNCLFIYTNFNG